MYVSVSNFFAQPDALAVGKTQEECAAEGDSELLQTHKVPLASPMCACLPSLSLAHWILFHRCSRVTVHPCHCWCLAWTPSVSVNSWRCTSTVWLSKALCGVSTVSTSGVCSWARCWQARRDPSSLLPGGLTRKPLRASTKAPLPSWTTT